MDVGKEKGRKGGVEREGRGVEERERWDERGRKGRDERGEERKEGGRNGGEGREELVPTSFRIWLRPCRQVVVLPFALVLHKPL